MQSFYGCDAELNAHRGEYSLVFAMYCYFYVCRQSGQAHALGELMHQCCYPVRACTGVAYNSELFNEVYVNTTELSYPRD